MQGRTHALMGAAAGLTLALTTHATLDLALVAATAGIIGGLLPDIDHPNSTICNRLPLIRIFTFWLPHRTLTHSAIAIIVLSVGYTAFVTRTASLPIGYTGAIIFGYALHVLADMMTRTGVPLLYPFSGQRQYLLPRGFRLTTGGVVESIIAAAVSLLLVYQVAKLLGVY